MKMVFLRCVWKSTESDTFEGVVARWINQPTSGKVLYRCNTFAHDSSWSIPFDFERDQRLRR